MSVSFHRDGVVAFVTLNNPPVNAIGLAVRQGLVNALDWVEAETGLERVVFSGAGRAFAAGGDAREFDGPPLEPHLPDVVSRIEACPVPWIAAITGLALGGGCELALACRYRIAGEKVQLGLPEVSLGVVPGAGGTQRLPRLIGVPAALDMIANGKPITAGKALSLGLVDQLSNEPEADAASVSIELVTAALPLNKRASAEADDKAVANAIFTADAKMRGQIAPKVAIDLVARSTVTPFELGLAKERDAFLDLRNRPQSQALRHVFFAERAAKQPTAIKAESNELAEIAVVGGGTMGAGIAYALLNAGYHVTVLETDADGVARGTQNVEQILASSLKRGLIDDAGADARRDRLVISDDYAAVGSCQLAIEAAFESMEVKQSVFASLEAAMPTTAILATNTSYLNVNAIADGLKDPTRLLGLHFFAPAHIMRLLEIIKADHSSDRAIATGFALGKRLRKVPVLSGVCDGFIGNRILARYREAADALMIDGSNPWDIDAAMRDFGYAMGPYETQDLSGLDIGFANRRRLDATRDPNRRYVRIGDRMVEEGFLGRKSSCGWYDYTSDERVPNKRAGALIAEEAAQERIERRNIGPEEIQETLLLAMINEAADILHEGIAAQSADVDLVTVFGYGFPKWRGGLMHYAHTLGHDQVEAKIETLAAQDPIAWSPSPGLRPFL